MIRLAFSSNAYKKNTLCEAIDSVAAIGYRGVEVMADVPHALPSKFDANGRHDVRKHIETSGTAGEQRQCLYALRVRRYVSSDVDRR